MKKILAYFVCFCTITLGSATAQVLNDSGQHGKMLLQTKKANNLNTIEGSPYENESFQPGIIMMEGNQPVNAFLRYDVLNDEMEIKTEKNEAEIYVLPDKNNTDYAINSNKYVFKSIQNDGNLIKGYFLEHFNGENVGLFKKLSVTKTEPYKAQSGYKKDRPSQILINEKYYITFADGTTYDVRLKAKDFKKVLPKSNELNSYFSDNKIKDLEDFIGLLEWYDKQQG